MMKRGAKECKRQDDAKPKFEDKTLDKLLNDGMDDVLDRFFGKQRIPQIPSNDKIDWDIYPDDLEEYQFINSLPSTSVSNKASPDKIFNSSLDIIQIDITQSSGTTATGEATSHNFEAQHQLSGSNEASQFFGNCQNDGHDENLKSSNLPHSKELLDIFHNVFHLETFRTNQLEAINAALLGHDCFVLMPTGGGKSLCYQLPSLMASGVSVVVSPLRSLILDQTTKMNALSPGCAAALTSDIDPLTLFQTWTDLNSANGRIRILFVTPEKIRACVGVIKFFEALHKRGRLTRFIMDEASERMKMCFRLNVLSTLLSFILSATS